MWQVDSSLCLPLRALPLPTVCRLRVLTIEQRVTRPTVIPLPEIPTARWELWNNWTLTRKGILLRFIRFRGGRANVCRILCLHCTSIKNNITRINDKFPPINIDQALPNLVGLDIYLRLKRISNERQRGREVNRQTQQKPDLCLHSKDFASSKRLLHKGNICHKC